MAINFEPLIKKKNAITYNEDSLLESQTKAEMSTSFTSIISFFAGEALKLHLTELIYSLGQ